VARQPRVERRLLHLSWAALHAPPFEAVAGRCDVVHALAPVVPLPTRRAPLVVTVHDLLPLQHPEWYARGPRWGVVRALRHAADHATRIITPSKRVRSDLAEILGVGPERVDVVPEGVGGAFTGEVEAIALTSVLGRLGLEHGGYAVCVGEIGPRKNLPTLFRALARLRTAGEPVPRLVVVGGDGMDAGTVRALPARLGVEDRVVFTGRLPDETLAAVVQGARVLVHASSFEGFGLTPLEAMAAGTAVVVSDAGSLPEVVGDAGLLVDPLDVDGWAAALRRVMTDDDWVATAVVAGRARAAGFTWLAAAEQTWAVYDRVLAC
jgi:glycosyltransferase involved in cell wall biosynthesis